MYIIVGGGGIKGSERYRTRNKAFKKKDELQSKTAWLRKERRGRYMKGENARAVKSKHHRPSAHGRTCKACAKGKNGA